MVVCATGTLLCVLYLPVCVAGYLQFHDAPAGVPGDIMQGYGDHNAAAIVARVALALAAAATFPLCAVCSRDNLLALWTLDEASTAKRVGCTVMVLLFMVFVSLAVPHMEVRGDPESNSN